jgi:hypothetical protein
MSPSEMSTDIAFPSISANALFLLCLYNRYAAIVSRIRTFDRERLASREVEWVQEIDYQTQRLLRRASWIRGAIGLLHAAMVCFGTHGFLAVWGEAGFAARDSLTRPAYVAVMSGLTCTTLASAVAACELYASLGTVHHEASAFTALSR